MLYFHTYNEREVKKGNRNTNATKKGLVMGAYSSADGKEDKKKKYPAWGED
jgi:hypothetical protein